MVKGAEFSLPSKEKLHWTRHSELSSEEWIDINEEKRKGKSIIVRGNGHMQKARRGLFQELRAWKKSYLDHHQSVS